jgi:plastocyanin
MPLLLALLLVPLLVLAGGCSSNEQVGSKKNLQFDEQKSGRLGEKGTTTTTAAQAAKASTTTTAAPKVPTTAPPTTGAPRPTSPPTTAPAGFVVKIVSGGQGFDPYSFIVKRGTRVSVQNTDGQPRTFTSDEAGAFDSGMLAPGATFVYVADRAGKFNFHDETRPYGVGQMEVQ